MTTISYRVEVYFDFPYSPDFFTLDDPTRGLLDGTTYKLYSASPVDVTPDVTYVQIRRGNNSQLFPDATAGTATVTLNNDDSCSLGARTYDPLNTASPYYGNILPNRKVIIYADDQVQFTGRIADWNFTYDVNGRAIATMNCVDGLGILARQELDTFTATSQDTGARVSAILSRSEVQWPYARDIGTGISTLKADTVTFGSNVLGYLNTVTASELGLIFAAKDGTLVFRNRHSSLNASAVVAFGDSGDVVPFAGIETQYGSEVLYNRIVVNSDGLSTVTVLDVTSQAEYGIATYSTPTLLLSTSAQALDMGAYLSGIYANPAYRVTGIRIELNGLNSTQLMRALGLELGDVVSVTFTPNGSGTAIDRTTQVSGISHEIGRGRHSMSLSLTAIDQRSFFQLDDTTFGVLDDSRLAF